MLLEEDDGELITAFCVAGSTSSLENDPSPCMVEAEELAYTLEGLE